MSRKGLPTHYRSENLPPPNTKGHGLLLSAAQAVVPRPYENLQHSDYRVDTHSFHLFIEEMCRTISIQEVLSTSVSNWNSTLTHLYYGVLLMYRVICAKIEADRATDDERLFVRVFETRLGVDHIIPQPLIPYFIHLGAVRLTDAYGIISPRGPDFAQNTNRAINLEQRGICKIPCFPLLAFFLDSLARANPHCLYDVNDHDSPSAGFPQANFQFAGLHSNDPNHYSRIISTPGFYKMLVHKSSDFIKKTNRTHSTEAQVTYHQPNSAELNRYGITPLDPGFFYRILYKLTDRHEIATGSGISFILTGPNLHTSLQADLRGPYFVDFDEDHDNNVPPDPLRYQLYKFNAEHPAYHAKNRVNRMFRRALSTINHEVLDKVPTIETLETAKPKVRLKDKV